MKYLKKRISLEKRMKKNVVKYKQRIFELAKRFIINTNLKYFKLINIT